MVLRGASDVLAAKFAEVVDGRAVGAAVVVVVVVVTGARTSSLGTGFGFRMEGAASRLKIGAITGLLVVGSGC